MHVAKYHSKESVEDVDIKDSAAPWRMASCCGSLGPSLELLPAPAYLYLSLSASSSFSSQFSVFVFFGFCVPWPWPSLLAFSVGVIVLLLILVEIFSGLHLLHILLLSLCLVLFALPVGGANFLLFGAPCVSFCRTLEGPAYTRLFKNHTYVRTYVRPSPIRSVLSYSANIPRTQIFLHIPDPL